MEVHCDEGVASRIGPRSCVGIREDVGEASTEVCIGQDIEPRKNPSSGCRRRPRSGRQNVRARHPRVPVRSGVVADPGMC